MRYKVFGWFDVAITVTIVAISAALGGTIVKPLVPAVGPETYAILRWTVEALTAPGNLAEWAAGELFEDLILYSIVAILVAGAIAVANTLFSPLVYRLILSEAAEQDNVSIDEFRRTKVIKKKALWRFKFHVSQRVTRRTGLTAFGFTLAGAIAGLLGAGLAWIGTTFASGFVQISAVVITWLVGFVIKELFDELAKELAGGEKAQERMSRAFAALERA